METTSRSPKPPSILVIGWTTLIASAIMIVVNGMSLVSYSLFDDLKLSLSSSYFSQSVPQSMSRVLELYRYSTWWTWYGIFFFVFVLVAAVQFLRLKAWGRKALEIACWIGLLNALIDTVLSYVIWRDTQEALSIVMHQLGGGQYAYLNPVGLLTIVLGFFLWVIPSAGMIIYLRRPMIKQTVSLH